MTAAMYYGAAFNAPNINAHTPLGTITFTKAGEPTFAITLANLRGDDVDSEDSAYFWHAQTSAAFTTIGNDNAETVRFRHYSTLSWGAVLQAAVNAAMTANSWPTSNFVVEWLEESGSTPVPFYRFSYGSSFQFQFSTEAGARMFGVNNTTISALAASHLLGTPSYVVFPSGSQKISTTGDDDSALDYEPNAIASLSVSDSGISYGNGRLVAPIYRNWRHGHLSPSNVYRKDSSSPLETLQGAIFQHCRSKLPFVVAHGGFGGLHEYEVFLLRDDGNMLSPTRASVGNNVYLHQRFRTMVVGHWESVS